MRVITLIILTITFHQFVRAQSLESNPSKTSGNTPADTVSEKVDVDSVPKIDPRKFLVVTEIKKGKPNKDSIVWDKFIQRRNILDSRSDILIHFKQDELKNELYFTGNISLMAQINDSDPIEIPPYSMIGEDYSKVGTKSLSPYEFSLSFVTQMLDIYELTKKSRFKNIDKKLGDRVYNSELQKKLSSASATDSNLLASIDKYLEQRQKVFTRDSSSLRSQIYLNKSDSSEIAKSYESIYKDLKLKNILALPLKEIIDQLKTDTTKLGDNAQQKVMLIKLLESLFKVREPEDYYFNKRDTIAISFQLEKYFKENEKADLLKGLYKNIGTSNGIPIRSLKKLISDIRKLPLKQGGLLLNILESSYVNDIDFALQHLMVKKNYFDRFMKTDRSTRLAFLTVIHKDSIWLAHTVSFLTKNYDKLQELRSKIMSIKSSIDPSATAISDAIRFGLEDTSTQSVLLMDQFVSMIKDLRDFEQIEYDEAKRYYTSKRDSFKPEHTYIEKWARYIANEAAKQLYKKLIVGKIDLTKRSISDDSKLTLYVLWFEEPGKPAQKLPIASFTLRKLGWNEQIVDSFLLINRLSDPGTPPPASGGKIEPTSRFKGAPGASLMWTYTVGEKGDFFQRLQPSFGINVSYLDFDASQSFEVGVGAMMGFWKNKVFIGWGRNLHVPDNSSYFSIGFSFAKIAENWNSRQSNNQTKP